MNGFDTPLMSLFSESFYPAVLMALAAMGGKSDRGGEVARSLAPTVVHP